jgi:hypothetical protein
MIRLSDEGDTMLREIEYADLTLESLTSDEMFANHRYAKLRRRRARRLIAGWAEADAARRGEIEHALRALEQEISDR